MRIGQHTHDSELRPVLEYGGTWFDLNKLLKTDTDFIDTGSDLPLHLLRPFLTDYSYLQHLLESLDDPTRDQVAIPEPKSFALPCEPRQIICVGRNYAAHAAELGNDVPDEPMLFNKLPGTCIPDDDTIEFPESLGRVDYEGEVAVVLGTDLWRAKPDDIYDAIWGYTLLNDVTARTVQHTAKETGHPWLLAKNHRTFTPFGPTITLKEALMWPLELDVTLSINGETRQQGNTRDFIFGIPALLSYISAQIPLFSGDIVATGTPEGVGPLHHGDKVEITAPGLGILRSAVRSNRNQSSHL